MKKVSNTAIITSGFRHLLCAGLSMAITAFFFWSFVASTTSVNWMGSSALDQTELHV